MNNEFPTINKFLCQKKFSNTEQILIKWRLFGDNDVIERDMSIPVHEFFKKEIKRRDGTEWTKCIVRGHLSKSRISDISCHVCHDFFANYASGRAVHLEKMGDMLPNSEHETIFVNHYRTKTLKEFLEHKFYRGNRIFLSAPTTLDQYFFRDNTKTAEKEAYAAA